MTAAAAVFRVHWTPGSDELLAVCHCTSWRVVDDPIEAWQWLLAHPDGHVSAAGARPAAPGESVPDRPRAPAVG